ncbi:helix-turn-helix domain-containing protein [Sphingomonas oligophenolica]
MSGASVKKAAAAAGYATPSAFLAAFRAVFGITPARYFGRA